ncbi:hypothetical protein C8R45DRAFT_565638 [Mycena sanguinolenta]|nr:hypothetical protein C8R45DRAFT_565638 [Mycena sanguinolenta]
MKSGIGPQTWRKPLAGGFFVLLWSIHGSKTLESNLHNRNKTKPQKKRVIGSHAIIQGLLALRFPARVRRETKRVFLIDHLNF